MFYSAQSSALFSYLLRTAAYVRLMCGAGQERFGVAGEAGTTVRPAPYSLRGPPRKLVQQPATGLHHVQPLVRRRGVAVGSPD